MSKQRPDANKLANELLGASAFFRPSPKVEDLPKHEEPVAPPLASRQSAPEPPAPRDVTTSRRHGTMTSLGAPSKRGDAASPAQVDINTPTSSRDSLRLSTEETRALDDLRQTLKWDYDLSVSKNDICRAALHALIEEFRSKGDRSDTLKRLKRKQTSR